jgi:micrococcal nuclease
MPRMQSKVDSIFVRVATVVLLASPACAEPVKPGEIVIIDGDTVAIGNERIRLKGFDTPETYDAKCADELALGLEATDALGRLLKSGKVEIKRNRRKDLYGRTLARITVNGVDVARIGEGLAVRYNGRGRRLDWCRD